MFLSCSVKADSVLCFRGHTDLIRSAGCLTWSQVDSLKRRERERERVKERVRETEGVGEKKGVRHKESETQRE